MISRYSAGYYGGAIFAFLNILTRQSCLARPFPSTPGLTDSFSLRVEMGFSVTCVILGGQTLANINDKLPLTAGIIIVAVCHTRFRPGSLIYVNIFVRAIGTISHYLFLRL